jgi:aspartyl aminopeptidase
LEKTETELLKEKLFLNKKVGWTESTEEEKQNIFRFSEDYMYYLNKGKTEKEIIENSKDILIKNGFRDISEFEELHPGDKIYFVNRSRNIFAAVIGEEPLENGLRIVAAHSDSPRIDLKQNPVIENSGFALFKTHYYGGIRKYQWATIPLSMHALFVKKDGEKINVVWGEDEAEPAFVISDLPPHLSQTQNERKLREGISGEELNILIGSIPYADVRTSESVKLNILKILNDKYGITEVDFTSSEVEFVPAFKARSVGFDGSMVAAYGQDDKVCCYTALRGILDIGTPRKTAICILTDREEVGFDGNTGMSSRMFETFVAELLDKKNENKVNMMEKVFAVSEVLSADVTTAFDPTFQDVFERKNAAEFGKGVCISKYTGSAGKSRSSEASAEFIAKIRRVFDNAKSQYQSAELGKVDKGGGGTIALTLANRGMDVLDCGVPVLAMHSPYEITSKYDIYQAYKAYEAFYKC